MTAATPASPSTALRLWPGVAIVAIQWLLRFVVPAVFDDAMPVAVMGGMAGGLLVILWWAFLSRAPVSERVGAVVAMALALVLTPFILHESMATAMMGLLFPVYAIPVLSLAFVGWAVLGRRLADSPRRLTMVATIALACAVWSLVRTGGFTAASMDQDFAWRWSPTPEERLLAAADGEVMVAGSVTAPPTTAEWPGFRGPVRDSVVPGLRIATDWSSSPPVELWRRPIGPGWSSFAVHGDLVYTQEQRGDEEVVSCYNLKTGEPVWRHGDAARFWEANAGAGPRATPTLHDGRVYTLGATGVLNVLDAADGRVVWSRNAADDTGARMPGWGFAGSPLVVDNLAGDDLVVVATAGVLAAYDRATGEPRWTGPNGGDGYSSPQRFTIDGIDQILLASAAGAIGVAPVDGQTLWEYESPSGTRIVQPTRVTDRDILVSAGEDAGGTGLRRLSVYFAPGGWIVDESWSTRGLKPYFNDLVIHRDHAYGFDNSILACIDLETGKRLWKGGRYGHGQLVLLKDQDLLLVLSESGELALVSATPDGFTQRARMGALEGKTWNHPVVVGDVLLVRNSEEMAAFRLTLAPGAEGVSLQL